MWFKMDFDAEKFIVEKDSEFITTVTYLALLAAFSIMVHYLSILNGLDILFSFMTELLVVMLGFLRTTSYGARHGIGLRSKAKIVFCSLLNSIQWVLGERIRWIERSIKILTPNFSDVTVETGGYRYLLIDSESLFLVAFHESWMGKYLRVEKGDIFIDIGAHIGKYSIPLSKIASRIVAVEPDPDNYECLKRNVETNRIRNITTVNMLAWKEDTTVKFYLTDKKGGGTTKEGLPLRTYVGRYLELQAETMDNMLKSLGISEVDWIKIDVEGAEYEVLKGLRETLSKCKPHIIAEIMKPNLKKVLALMDDLDYNAEPITESESPPLIYYRFKPLTVNGSAAHGKDNPHVSSLSNLPDERCKD
jgi:FkbM family methyltransferase